MERDQSSDIHITDSVSDENFLITSTVHERFNDDHRYFPGRSYLTSFFSVHTAIKEVSKKIYKEHKRLFYDSAKNEQLMLHNDDNSCTSAFSSLDEFDLARSHLENVSGLDPNLKTKKILLKSIIFWYIL